MTAWRDRAACRGTDPNLWVPNQTGDVRAFYARVRPMCLACPVRWDCLTHAVETNEAYGMWGGLTPKQRRGLTLADIPRLRRRWEDVA